MMRSAAARAAQGMASVPYAHYEAVRGVLILAVIFDHNDIIRGVRSVQDWFLPMTFHVAGFLLLPFLVSPKRLSLQLIRDYAFRYLTPFVFALLGYSILFQIFVVGRAPDVIWLKNLVAAMLWADPWSLLKATGFIVLWFLPALLATVLLAALFNASSRGWRIAILLFAVCVHLLVGFAPVSLKSSIPQGLLIALYMFPLGVAARYCIPKLMDSRPVLLMVTILAALALAGWAFERGHEIEIAILVVPTLMQPAFVILNDFGDLIILAILIIASPVLIRIPGLQLLGRYSLLVYLIHPIFYKAIFLLLLPHYRVTELTTSGDVMRYSAGAVISVVSATGCALLAAVIIHRTRLRALVTPRNFYDWLPVTFAHAAPSRRA